MMKNSVVKTLNKPPMAKKAKPLEVTIKEEPKPENKQNGDGKASKKKDKQPIQQVEVQTVNPLALK